MFECRSGLCRWGNSTTVGGWEISPDPGINLNITGVNSNPAIVIQDESATFDNDGPLNITFKQLSADAVALIEFQGATIDNATGQDWSGFTFSLTGPASFNGVSNAFVPPQSPGVDYNIASLNTPIIVKYTGTQLSDTVSTWGGTTSNDELLVTAEPSDNVADASTFAPGSDADNQRSPSRPWPHGRA